MTSDKIKEILEKHRKWLTDEEGGECANLSWADLSGADLSGANLSRANLSWANLSWANLSGANLSWADLSEANLSRADLSGANLSKANLSEANLSRANLSWADLSGANLSGADLSEANLSEANLSEANLSRANLSWADLSGANLSGADLSEAIYNEHTAFFALCCPEEGSFVGYKKAGGKIVKLQIPKTAKRSSATSRKCRCSKAKVISITNTDGSESGLEKVDSDRDASFVYEVGKTVSVDNFDENRWNECSTGIHFFITRDEAVRYN